MEFVEYEHMGEAKRGLLISRQEADTERIRIRVGVGQDILVAPDRVKRILRRDKRRQWQNQLLVRLGVSTD